MMACHNINKLRINSDLLPGPPYTPLQNITHSELFGYLFELYRFSLISEPLAKVSEKHIEKVFPEELESISCWVFDLSSFGSHLKDGFLSAGHIDLPLSTFFFAV